MNKILLVEDDFNRKRIVNGYLLVDISKHQELHMSKSGNERIIIHNIIIEHVNNKFKLEFKIKTDRDLMYDDIMNKLGIVSLQSFKP